MKTTSRGSKYQGIEYFSISSQRRKLFYTLSVALIAATGFALFPGNTTAASMTENQRLLQEKEKEGNKQKEEGERLKKEAQCKLEKQAAEVKAKKRQLELINKARYELVETTRAMDAIALHLEEYGHIAVSSPLFVEPTNNFAFSLHRGATNYFNEAKREIEGAVRISDQKANGFGLSLDAQFDPTLVGAYGAAMTDYMKQMGAREMKSALVNSAAEAQFQADFIKASQETNLITRSQLMSIAYSNYANAYPAPTNAPTFPTASSVNSSLPGSATNSAGRPAVKDVFSGSTFSPAGQLVQDVLNSTPPTINNRVALNIAAGDVAAEGILNLLLDPQKAGQFSGKKVVFGITSVSIDPGWRTERDYAGDITVDTTITNKDAGWVVLQRLLQNPPESLSHGVLAKLAADVHLPYETFTNLAKITNYTDAQYLKFADREPIDPETGRLLVLPDIWDAKNSNNLTEPMVVAVTPGMDVETLDLASSFRRQFEMSLKLAVALQQAGMKGAANSFFEHASRLEADSRTRTPIPIINTYSLTGSQFGFQIGPRYQAVDDPAERKAKGANILHRQSFPAILIVGINQSYFRPLIKKTVGECQSVTFTLQEPGITVTPTTRWLRINHSSWKRSFKPHFSEEDYVALSQRFLVHNNLLSSNLGQLGADAPKDLVAAAKLIEVRSKSLRALAFIVKTTQVYAPEELVPGKAAKKTPVIAGTEPASIYLSRASDNTLVPQTTVFAIQGAGLKQIDGTTVTSMSTNVTGLSKISQTDDLFIVKATVSSADAPVIFEMPIKDEASGKNIGNLYSKPIMVTAEPVAKSGPPPLVFEQKTTIGNDKQITTNITLIQVSTNLSTNVLFLLQNITQKSEEKAAETSIRGTNSNGKNPQAPATDQTTSTNK